MRRIVLPLCVGLTILSGVLRGVVDYRWGHGEEMQAAAKRVQAFPERIGPWRVVHEQALESTATEMLRVAGSLVRTYVHDETGQTVNLTFLVGPAGPLAIHTPEVCYGSNNFTVVEKRRQVLLPDVYQNQHPFSVITFAENNMGNRLQRVYYAWNRGGSWMAPHSPRTAFAGTPMLYKAQVTTYLTDAEGIDAAESFIRASLPAWQAICNVQSTACVQAEEVENTGQQRHHGREVRATDTHLNTATFSAANE